MMSFFEKFKQDWKDKKVLIMGLGLQGRGIQDAEVFAKIGSQVTVTDLKTARELNSSLKQLDQYAIKYVLGKHRQEDFLASDLIIRNADVDKDSPFLTLARNHKIRIEMDESLFAQYATVKIIGITGTRGKSTTTNIIYKIIKEAKLPVWLGGNIAGLATLPLLAQVKENDLVVLELSSWQLQGFGEAHLSPHIAVMTNIYEDHLNRYHSMAEYIDDKKIIYQYQKSEDWLVLNSDDKDLKLLSREAKGKVAWFSSKDIPDSWQLKLKGSHNKSNLAACMAVAKILGISNAIIKKAAENFITLPYRLEPIAIINGVTYINDTTSTTPAAGIVALNSIDKPIILISGGSSKKLTMSQFAQLIAKKVKKVVLLSGAETNNLQNLIKRFGGEEKIIGVYENFRQAIVAAKNSARVGDVVLLSPGCASFGMFQNEFDRGQQFNEIVKTLTNG